MQLYAILAVGFGAAFGALLRYGLGLALNGLVPPMPMGTLASNLIAAYIVGVVLALFAAVPNISPLWRLLIVTGFAGGLSTFSTFSAEFLALLRDGRWLWVGGMLALHLGGSLVMVVLGMGTVSLVRSQS